MFLTKMHSFWRFLKNIKKIIGFVLYPITYYFYSKKIFSFHSISFSQEGEDLILKRIFEKQENGFYVDIGAHHPQRFSNTYLFYLRGWRGINVDAMPGSMKSFEELRPEDTNLEEAISNSSEKLSYYMFDEPALNGFSSNISHDRDRLTKYKIIDEKLIETVTLSEILDKYLPKDQNIDFLNIDVEGLDLQVLQSNNWLIYKPKVILVEDLAIAAEAWSQESKISHFMNSQGYELFAKTFNTAFYRLKKT